MGQIPSSHKGKLDYCDICGVWYGEREGKLFKRRGLTVCRPCYDTLTDEEREQQKQK